MRQTYLIVGNALQIVDTQEELNEANEVVTWISKIAVIDVRNITQVTRTYRTPGTRLDWSQDAVTGHARDGEVFHYCHAPVEQIEALFTALYAVLTARTLQGEP